MGGAPGGGRGRRGAGEEGSRPLGLDPRPQAQPASHRPGPLRPALPAPPSGSQPVPREESELQGFLLPSLAGRLRTAEQEAIWGGMGAVRRRQPPEDPFPPPPPSQLRQPA